MAEYLTLDETVRALGVTRATIWRWVRAGRLTAYTDPRNAQRSLYRADEVRRLAVPAARARAI